MQFAVNKVGENEEEEVKYKKNVGKTADEIGDNTMHPLSHFPLPPILHSGSWGAGYYPSYLRVKAGTTLPMLEQVHHTISALHLGILVEVCDFGHGSFWMLLGMPSPRTAKGEERMINGWEEEMTPPKCWDQLVNLSLSAMMIKMGSD